jgi:hypothetical protein
VFTVLHGDSFYLPSGVAVADDSVYVLEYGLPMPGMETRVRKVTPDGSVTIVAGCPAIMPELIILLPLLAVVLAIGFGVRAVMRRVQRKKERAA